MKGRIVILVESVVLCACRFILPLLVISAAPVLGQVDMCPLLPYEQSCPRDPSRFTIQERDVDGDGLPDNSSQLGGFCTGNAPASCNGIQGSDVRLDLLITNPSIQDVTCSIPPYFGSTDPIWFMSDFCDTCLATGMNTVTLFAGTTTDSTIKIVVTDDDAEICPCGGIVTCTFSREVVCDDGADGDGDGLIDTADPDCCLDSDGDGYCAFEDCDNSNVMVHQAPEYAGGLSVAKGVGGTELSWPVPTATWADVVTGDLADVRSFDSFAGASCLEEDELHGSSTDTRPDPATGAVDYYLLRHQNSCAAGSYSVEKADRSMLDSTGPCAWDASCSGCEFCQLDDPGPTCGPNQHCLPTAGGFPEVECLGPVGTGTHGTPCIEVQDCAPGHTCILNPLTAANECMEWCDIAVSPTTCPTGGTCVSWQGLVIGGQVWGHCLFF